MKPVVICLMGPTAAGKTALSLALARRMPIEIINVDSAQIYREMDIGTGKPDADERKRVPHHLMDFLDPALAYSAAQFRQDAITIIQAIIHRGSVPVLVGGTMLYFKALQQGLSELPNADPKVRQQLETQLLAQGLPALYAQLGASDPISADRIKPNDSQRIIRALEIFAVSGKPWSYWLAQPKAPLLPYQFINIGLVPLTTERDQLHTRIAQRFDQMLATGLITEGQKLLARGDLDLSMPAMRAVGYRQLFPYLRGECSFEQMRLQAVAATRQLAKRQLTWIRHWPEIKLLDFQDPMLAEKVYEMYCAVLRSP